jgi:MFS family permease
VSAPSATRSRLTVDQDHPHYKWIALSNTTLGVLMATINSSIVIISLPDIFRGIKLDPLKPGNVSYLLWMLMGFLLVTAVLVVTLGRLGDIYGRVRIYNLGFVVFTLGSVALVFDPFTAGGGAMWLILWRVVQGVGAAMLFANSTAILTDAFPANRRGLALGINQVAAIAGSFIGLIVGGVLAPIDWRLVFFISVPFGVLGTVWSYRSLRETVTRTQARIDWWGNLLFAGGLAAVLAAITYGIQPYGGHDMGWTNPWVLAGLIGGSAMLVAFCVVEGHVTDPMFDLALFKIKAFSAGNLAGLLASISRGGLQFMLIIWLQGIWLPLHGYSFANTPLWAGIYLLPLTVSFLVAGPLSGFYSDRFGARAFATGGLALVAVSFLGLLVLPTDFNYWAFAGLLVLNGIGSGLFSSPNTTAIMNSVPANRRGAAAGMRGTFFNAGTSLSIGVFFTMMIIGLSSSLPQVLTSGLRAHGVPAQTAAAIGHEPPVGSLFAAFLGYNPIGTTLSALPAAATRGADLGTLTSKQFFPRLIEGPFHHGLVIVFTVAIVMSLVGAVASLFRGGRYVHDEHQPDQPEAASPAPDGLATADAGQARTDAVAGRRVGTAGAGGDGRRHAPAHDRVLPSGSPVSR